MNECCSSVYELRRYKEGLFKEVLASVNTSVQLIMKHFLKYPFFARFANIHCFQTVEKTFLMIY